ncbi:MAG: signal peptidase I [Sphingomonadaceae bacterium]
METAAHIEAQRLAHAESGARLAHTLGGAVRLVALALVIALGLRTFVVQPFAIPSGSMAPGLEPGDFILVNKMAYGWSPAAFPFAGPLAAPGEQPARLLPSPVRPGDVVVFAGPQGQDYVKRVVATGGDRVELIGGRLVVNGLRVGCAPTGPGICREQLPNGRSHRIRPDGTGSLADHPEILVPAGHLFLLGDNRGASADSRLPRAAGGLGLVPESAVLGRVERIFFAADRDHGIRWQRIGRRID